MQVAIVTLLCQRNYQLDWMDAHGANQKTLIGRKPMRFDLYQKETAHIAAEQSALLAQARAGWRTPCYATFD